jgi:hypothetical protein
MRNNWSSSGSGSGRFQSKPVSNSGWYSNNKDIRSHSEEKKNEKKRSSNWSKQWNTVNIEMPPENEKSKKRKFGSGWDEKDNALEPDIPESNLFVFSLNNNNSVEKESIEHKRKESPKNRAAVSLITQLPIDPFEVSHCPSWEAKRRLRCKLAITKPCGKHIIFEA